MAKKDATVDRHFWDHVNKCMALTAAYPIAIQAFTSLKTAVLKADAAELSAQLGQAVLAWELLGSTELQLRFSSLLIAAACPN